LHVAVAASVAVLVIGAFLSLARSPILV
jgi:hypothetical protein